MSKSAIAFSILLIILVGFSGVGIWQFSKRQTLQSSDVQNTQAMAYSIDEVSQHNLRDDCWTIISGDVYDLTDYIKRHPGGDEILRACGSDATSQFNSRQTADGQPIGTGTPHSQAAREQLNKLKIGTFVEN